MDSKRTAIKKCDQKQLNMYIFIMLQMKLPASTGQKKVKAIEQVLEELGIGITALIAWRVFELQQVVYWSS